MSVAATAFPFSIFFQNSMLILIIYSALRPSLLPSTAGASCKPLSALVRVPAVSRCISVAGKCGSQISRCTKGEGTAIGEGRW